METKSIRITRAIVTFIVLLGGIGAWGLVFFAIFYFIGN
jgi:hypothetical protein